MKVIHKYPLKVTDEQTLKIPTEAKILSVQFQNEQLCLWALHEKENTSLQDVKIIIIGTGHPVQDHRPGIFLGTVQQFSSKLVWHVFYHKIW